MTNKQQRIILLVDNSGSMTGQPIEDIKQSLAMLKQEINQYNRINKDKKKLEVITFASESKLISNNALHKITASGNTKIGQAYRKLRYRLLKVDKTELSPIILLLTDGAIYDENIAKMELGKLKKIKVFSRSKKLAFAYNDQTNETRRILTNFTNSKNLVFYENSSKILKQIIGSLLPKIIFKKKRPKIQVNILSDKIKILKHNTPSTVKSARR